jgi:hypothetical protein
VNNNDTAAAFLTGIFCVIVLSAMFAFGWVASASTISWECRKIGTFYTGSTVFTCEKKENL